MRPKGMERKSICPDHGKMHCVYEHGEVVSYYCPRCGYVRRCDE